MGIIRLPPIILHAKQTLRPKAVHSQQYPKTAADVPKGHFAVYVGETNYSCKDRFVVPISYLLRQAEEEFGFDHPAGGLTIPLSEDTFLNITSHLNH